MVVSSSSIPFLDSREELLLKSLCNFYSTIQNFDRFYFWIGCDLISSRLLDFFVTNYAYEHDVNINGINIYTDLKLH